jgi:hypothetical protein
VLRAREQEDLRSHLRLRRRGRCGYRRCRRRRRSAGRGSRAPAVKWRLNGCAEGGRFFRPPCEQPVHRAGRRLASSLLLAQFQRCVRPTQPCLLLLVPSFLSVCEDRVAKVRSDVPELIQVAPELHLLGCHSHTVLLRLWLRRPSVNGRRKRMRHAPFSSAFPIAATWRPHRSQKEELDDFRFRVLLIVRRIQRILSNAYGSRTLLQLRRLESAPRNAAAASFAA